MAGIIREEDEKARIAFEEKEKIRLAAEEEHRKRYAIVEKIKLEMKEKEETEQMSLVDKYAYEA